MKDLCSQGTEARFVPGYVENSQRVETGKDEATYYTCDDDGNQTSKKVGDSLCYYNYDPDNMLTSFTEDETEADLVGKKLVIPADAGPGVARGGRRGQVTKPAVSHAE